MLTFLLTVGSIALAYYLRRAYDRLAAIEGRLEVLKLENATLKRLAADLRRQMGPVLPPPPSATEPPPAVSPAPVPFQVRTPEPAVPPPPPLPVPAAPVPAPVLAAAVPEPAEEPAAAPQEPVLPPPPPARPPLAPPPFQPQRAAVPPAPRQPFDWEGLIGVKLFSWIAGILLAVAALYFLRYSIDHGWLKPPIRMAIGLLTGAGLLVVCELKAARRYAVTANAMDAAGIAILFSTIFASNALWHLLGTATAFVLMALVTAVAVGLSIRRESLFIALLGLIGGFVTPALLSTGEDRPLPLFGYLLLLNAGLAWVAMRRSWPILSALSLAFTTFYQWGWVSQFLEPSRLPLALGIFLAFPLLAAVLPALARGQEGEGASGEDAGLRFFERIAAWSAALPLVFAVYLAAVPGYGERYVLLFGFLLVLDAGIAFLAARQGPQILHPAAGMATLLVTAIWLGTSYDSGAWPWILGIVSALVLFYLAAPWILEKLGRPLAEGGMHGTLTAPLLLFAIPVLLWIEPAAASPGLPFAVLFLLLAATAAFALLYEEGILHFLASFFAIAAEAIWSAWYLTPERLIPGISLYAVFGLFYLGVPLLARRLERELRPAIGAPALLLASLALLSFLAAGPVAPVALWGLALLLLLLNAGLFLEGGIGGRILPALAGILLSWMLIAVWWSRAGLAASLVPALALVAGFAVLALAGNVWMIRGRPGGPGALAAPGEGLYLALVGHAFLLFVASQGSLSMPPWPMLGVLAVLDIAVGVAALYLRRSGIHFGALVLSGLVLLVWLGAAGGDSRWTAVAVGTAAALSAFALVWIAAARRLEEGDGPLTEVFSRAALASLFLGQLVLIGAGLAAGAQPLAVLVPAHAAFLAVLLALAAWRGWSWPAPASVVVTAFAVVLWRTAKPVPGPWWHELVFAAVLYLVYLAYPLALGRRAERARAPFLAAVLASVPFFVFGRHALVAGGFQGMIGALPVLQAIALSVLLVRLLRLEKERAQRGARDEARLALMAGAVLAFVTVAIPLQLERQWITIGWALLAAALAWLYGRVPHRGLLLWTAGLLAAVFVRLALNPAVLSYHPRGDLPIWNWYLYTYLVAAVAFFLAGRLLKRDADRPLPLPWLPGAANVLGTVLLFLLVNIEIADFFSTGESLTFGFLAGRASLGEDVAYTLGWALFAIGLLVAGIVLRSRATRIAGIVLLLCAVLKGFLHDLAQLGGLYRVGSFVGLAACLALVAVLIQKFVLAARTAESGEGGGA